MISLRRLRLETDRRSSPFGACVELVHHFLPRYLARSVSECGCSLVDDNASKIWSTCMMCPSGAGDDTPQADNRAELRLCWTYHNEAWSLQQSCTRALAYGGQIYPEFSMKIARVCWFLRHVRGNGSPVEYYFAQGSILQDKVAQQRFLPWAYRAGKGCISCNGDQESHMLNKAGHLRKNHHLGSINDPDNLLMYGKTFLWPVLLTVCTNV